MTSNKTATIRDAIHCSHRSSAADKRIRETFARFSAHHLHHTSTDLPREFAEQVATDKLLERLRDSFITHEEIRTLHQAAAKLARWPGAIHEITNPPAALLERLQQIIRKLEKPE